jgi:hypothetical protein
LPKLPLQSLLLSLCFFALACGVPLSGLKSCCGGCELGLELFRTFGSGIWLLLEATFSRSTSLSRGSCSLFGMLLASLQIGDFCLQLRAFQPLLVELLCILRH